MCYPELTQLLLVRWVMGRFNSLRRTMGGFLPPLFEVPPSPDPSALRNSEHDEGVADDLRHIEILGRLILRTIHRLEKQMAERNYTTQEILDLVRAERGEIASMSAAMGALKSRLNASLTGEISPKGQAILNDIMSEVQGNSRAITAAVLNNDDDPTNDVDADGNPIVPPQNTNTNSDKAATTTTLSTSKAVVTVGEEVTFSAGVSAAKGIDKAITGSVTFSTDKGAIGSANLDSTGMAAFATTVPAGDHSITATYNGDDNFATSTSEPITQSAMPVEEPAPAPAPASPGVAEAPAT